MTAHLVPYKSLQVVSPDPTGTGGLALNGNFKALADLLINTGTQVLVGPGSSATASGTALKDAYTTAKALTPGGNTRSATNRVALLILPGTYDFGTTGLPLDTAYVDLIGLGTAADTIITGTDSSNTKGTIRQTVSDVLLKNLTIDTKVNVTLSNNSSDPAAYYPDASLSQTQIQNVVFGSQHDGTGSWSMRIAIEYSGTFADCTGGSQSFGGGGTASGTFTDCTGGAFSFGGTGQASGAFTRCVGGDGSFGAGTSSGTAAVMQDCQSFSRSDAIKNWAGRMIGCQIEVTGSDKNAVEICDVARIYNSILIAGGDAKSVYFTPVESGDSSNRLSGWGNITGLAALTNTDGEGKIYATVVYASSTYHVDFYKDVDETLKIGHTGNFTTTGNKSITADNSSGIGGTITIDSVGTATLVTYQAFQNAKIANLLTNKALGAGVNNLIGSANVIVDPDVSLREGVPVPENLILFWVGSDVTTAPTGWGWYGTLGKIVNLHGPTDTHGTGGSASHGHTILSHAHISDHTHAYYLDTGGVVNITSDSGGPGVAAQHDHSSGGTLTSGAASPGTTSAATGNVPSVSVDPYRYMVRLIYALSDGAEIPVDAAAIAGSSTVPSGWQAVGASSGLLANDNAQDFVTGRAGLELHFHNRDFRGHTHSYSHAHPAGAGASSAYGSADDNIQQSVNDVTVSDASHAHAAGSGTFASADANIDTMTTSEVIDDLPNLPAVDKAWVVLVKALGGAAMQPGLHALWNLSNGDVPTGWTAVRMAKRRHLAIGYSGSQTYPAVEEDAVPHAHSTQHTHNGMGHSHGPGTVVSDNADSQVTGNSGGSAASDLTHPALDSTYGPNRPTTDVAFADTNAVVIDPPWENFLLIRYE